MTEQRVADVLVNMLHRETELVGVTSLAIGADQLFARIVLTLGGNIEVVIPSKTYRDTFVDSEEITAYDALLSQASSVIQLPYIDSSEEAFMEAGREVVRRSDRLVAVWDGEPPRGWGGTGDVVAFAKDIGVPVVLVWPEGAARSDEEWVSSHMTGCAAHGTVLGQRALDIRLPNVGRLTDR